MVAINDNAHSTRRHAPELLEVNIDNRRDGALDQLQLTTSLR
jgi:hypothetical protein